MILQSVFRVDEDDISGVSILWTGKGGGGGGCLEFLKAVEPIR